ncbi:hypothetical protein MUO32_23725 [Shinella sp. CPCC 101442]|uniref:hypothetical protein n=1 Tax=Shinella sp. CPCC 101442 TaxID=2932265 RepID=UPI0021533079|nr:hypothetical protein [Shinella sp. CPCC 101442]MCR6502042.1 hypothetical protein [Shinella sp. CPCC 101442]
MQTLYGYQVHPGSDDTLFFALSIEKCREAAVEQRREMREVLNQHEVGAMAIYECLVRVDLVSLLEMLNDPDDAYRKLLLSKILVEVVVD